MTNKELIDALAKYPEDALIITEESELGDYYTLIGPKLLKVHVYAGDVLHHDLSHGNCWWCEQKYELKEAILFS